MNLYINESVKYFIIYSYITTILSAIISKKVVFKYSYRSYTQLKIIGLKSEVSLISNLLIYSLGIFLFIFFTMKTGFNSFTSGNLENDRIIARKGMGAITLLTMTFVSYSSLMLISNYKFKKIFRIIIILITIFILMSFGNRSPALQYLIMLFIVSSVVFFKNINIKKLLLILVILFLTMVLLGALRKTGNDNSIIDLFMARIGWRPYVTIHNFQLIYDFFPLKSDFIYGYSYLIELETLLPGYTPNFGTWVKELMGMSFEGGSLTLSYLGEAYINFGLFGILVYPIFYGFFMVFLYIKFTKKKYLTTRRIVMLMIVSSIYSGAAIVGIIAPTLYHMIPFIIVYSIDSFLMKFLKEYKKY